MIGKEMKQGFGEKWKEWRGDKCSSIPGARNVHCAASRLECGFTLLELMIVMFIMTILVTIALPQYQKSVLHAQETVLKDDLYKMRSLIDQYAADKGKLPQSLDDLVSSNYMREVPKDPITDEATWNAIVGEDPNSKEGEQGIIEVHSLSEDISTEGTPYSQW